MFRLDEDIVLEPAGTGAYTVTISGRWQVVVGPNGGYICAILLAGMKRELGDDGPPTRSITCHFLSASVAGEARLEVNVEKRGRSLSTVTSRLVQGDRTIAFAIATFGGPRPSIEFCDMSPPQVAPPETIAKASVMRPGMTHHAPFRDNFEQRLAIGPVPPGTTDQGHVGGWTRFADGRPFDDLAMVAIADSWFPSFAAKPLPAPMHAPTIDYTVHILADLPLARIRTEDFILAEFETRVASAGYLVEDGRIWTADGQLMATSRQLAAVMPRDS